MSEIRWIGHDRSKWARWRSSYEVGDLDLTQMLVIQSGVSRFDQSIRKDFCS